ncbi:hypothetical protein HMPREF9333_01481 [Johnsonella ignava ATCC 51276]|uniref:ABC-2 type transporter transmembrane domain-containing protein n=1 Tax=Johnsonella ignava ATCC 51276 TaxID=679200 RepID=G5GIU1_9FIRM|nr:ABC transporter permease [Johnsonella ignava]EHI55345.1 hypothetical protein HMPREF9333_01481 [Johnsonella ignava ATCC 51276]
MGKFWIYVITQMKRALRLLPLAVISSILILLGLGLTAFMLFKPDEMAQGKKKIEVAVVGNTEESYLGFGIGMLNNLDSSRVSINFSYMSEDEAKDKLLKGEVSGYIVIDDDFIEALGRGENIPIKYVTQKDGGLIEMVARDTAGVISSIIVNSEKAIYAMQAYMNINGREDEIAAHTKNMNNNFLSIVLSRKNIYDVNIADGLRGASTLEYYSSGLMIFFTFLLGIGSGLFLVKTDKALYRLLYIRGHNAVSQVLGEYIAFSMILMVSVFTIFLSISVVILSAHIDINASYENFSISAIEFVVRFIPVIFMLSAFIFLIYELAGDIISSVIAVFITAISLAYISGCLYPADFFPKAVRNISALLPLGAALRYMLGAFADSNKSVLYTVVLFIYILAFLILSFILRKQRLEKNF